MAKNYYTILGISPGAGRDEIKAAYRRLAKQFHPDHDGGDTETFKNIQEAYSMLTGAPDSVQSNDSNAGYGSYAPGRQGIRIRVHTRPFPDGSRKASRAASINRPGAEPLIPERDPMRGRREAGDRPHTMDGSETDLFDWIFRRFF